MVHAIQGIEQKVCCRKVVSLSMSFLAEKLNLCTKDMVANVKFGFLLLLYSLIEQKVQLLAETILDIDNL